MGVVTPLPLFFWKFEKNYETKKKEHRNKIEKRVKQLLNLYKYLIFVFRHIYIININMQS